MSICVLSVFDRSGVLRTVRGYVPVTLMLLAAWTYIAIKTIDGLISGMDCPIRGYSEP